jgi:hypothetical protein
LAQSVHALSFPEVTKILERTIKHYKGKDITHNIDQEKLTNYMYLREDLCKAILRELISKHISSVKRFKSNESKMSRKFNDKSPDGSRYSRFVTPLDRHTTPGQDSNEFSYEPRSKESSHSKVRSLYGTNKEILKTSTNPFEKFWASKTPHHKVFMKDCELKPLDLKDISGEQQTNLANKCVSTVDIQKSHKLVEVTEPNQSMDDIEDTGMDPGSIGLCAYNHTTME